jgi:NAD(P)-dependent dehydrogenase (short-subunit alcohol dehydrogenase family)
MDSTPDTSSESGEAGPGPLDVFAPGILSGRVAVVTGGGQGIGRATAMALAALGARVAVAGRTEATLERTRSIIEERGGECLAVPTDIRDVGRVDQLRDEVVRRFGTADFVINNAGGQFPANPTSISDRGWRSVIDLNLNGTWNMCSRFMPVLAEHGYGSIVNVVHIFVAERGASLFAHSGAARAGVVNLTRSLAPFLAAKGVTINVIAPGPIDTSAFLDQEVGALGVDTAGVDAYAKQMGLQRLGTAEEVAALIVFLCSPAARYVNGALLFADNGMTQMNWPLLDLMPFSEL